MISPYYLKYVYCFNYFLGSLLVGYVFFTDIARVRVRKYQIRFSLMSITLGGTLPSILLLIGFIVIITLYTPIIYQYDALARYLIEGRQLVEGSSSIVGTWPMFGDSMPIMSIISSWFFYLSDTPILRFISLTFLFFTIILVYNMGRKFTPENYHVSYVSILALISMISLQWYMAKTSLYIDLCFIFFAASSIYSLMIILEDGTKKIKFFLLGINLSLLLLTKEYGIFHIWFIIGFIIFSQYYKTIKKTYVSLYYNLFLIIPFGVHIFYNFVIYLFTKNINIISSIIFQLISIIISSILQIIIFISGNIKSKKINFYNFTIVIIPIFISLLFFINNFILFGTPLGTFKIKYIKALYDINIIYTVKTISQISYLNIPNLFFSNGILAVNLFPIIFYLITSLIQRVHKIQDRNSILLISWFFYSLLLLYYVNLGYIEGGYIRRILVFAIPIALMVGKGIQNLLEENFLPHYIGNLTYIFSNSLFLTNIWLIKLESTEWWLRNLDSVVINFVYAHPIEIFFYALPWLFFYIYIKFRKNNFIIKKIYSKNIRTKVSIIIIIISIITPSIIFYQAIKYQKTWNPSYYDEADAVKSYDNHWFIPVLDFYDSQLRDDNYSTVGFGVMPLQYFLKRPFIDLNHPRNWLIYLPLFQSISIDSLLNYLEIL
ncbi:MAG: hypothetical protein ACFFDN_23125, partial [Candidatus Hodarchaeota archaeon]